jgi:hypothetical protein
MVDKIAGILLIVALGMCVVAFPLVLWMLFADNGPRFRPMRHIVRPREDDSTDFSDWAEDRQKAGIEPFFSKRGRGATAKYAWG